MTHHRTHTPSAPDGAHHSTSDAPQVPPETTLDRLFAQYDKAQKDRTVPDTDDTEGNAERVCASGAGRGLALLWHPLSVARRTFRAFGYAVARLCSAPIAAHAWFIFSKGVHNMQTSMIQKCREGRVKALAMISQRGPRRVVLTGPMFVSYRRLAEALPAPANFNAAIGRAQIAKAA